MDENTTPLGAIPNDTTQNQDGNTGETGSNEPITDKKPLTKWQAQCKGDLKYNETLAEYPELNDAAEALLDLKKNAIKVPGEDAKEEDIQTFREALTKYGDVPEAPEGYEFEPPELEGYKHNPDTEKELKRFAHELGLNKQSFKKLNEWWNKQVSNSIESLKSFKKTAIDRQKAVIKEQFGPAYEQTQERGILAIGGTNLLQYMQKHPEVRYAPEIVSAFVHMGSLVSEDTLPKGEAAPEEKKGLQYPSMEGL